MPAGNAGGLSVATCIISGADGRIASGEDLKCVGRYKRQVNKEDKRLAGRRARHNWPKRE
jgi:hypothetical protein